jgi:hypothetical protein
VEWCILRRMEIPHPLPEPLIELIAQRFRVIGEPMRIKLLDTLRGGDATVGELVEHLGGIVSRTKDGTFVRYGIADPGVFDLCEQVCGGLRQQVTDLDQILTGGIA